MKKPAKNKSYLLIILASIIILVVTFTIAALNNQATQQKPPDFMQENTESNLKTFKSQILKFSINPPSNFIAEEKPGRVLISSNLGTIYIDRNGTNFNNLNDYLKDLDSRNKTTILEDNPQTINSYKARIRLIKNNNNEVSKTIVIFVDGWIFNIFTNSKDLYADLDQIAQSFKYTP